MCLNAANPAAILFKKVMGPLHQGRSNIPLYNSRKMVSVNMCLMSGKLATEACTHDIRLSSPLNPDDFVATSTALVYPEDMPKTYCDQHISMEICSGGGVATQWCRHFADEDSSVTISRYSLVKLTQSQMTEMLRAESYKLMTDYLRDDYVYLVDGVFTGFKGSLHQSETAPYKICPIHTRQAWESYQNTAPTDPSLPPDPTLPELTD